MHYVFLTSSVYVLCSQPSCLHSQLRRSTFAMCGSDLGGIPNQMEEKKKKGTCIRPVFVSYLLQGGTLSHKRYVWCTVFLLYVFS